MDFNSRFEYAYRMALISNDIYKLAIENCQGDYVNINTNNLLCKHSLQRYEECTSLLNMQNTLEPTCNDTYCQGYFQQVIKMWANSEVVQESLGIRQGTIGTWELLNETIHYTQGKDDTTSYA